MNIETTTQLTRRASSQDSLWPPLVIGSSLAVAAPAAATTENDHPDPTYDSMVRSGWTYVVGVADLWDVVYVTVPDAPSPRPIPWC